MMAIYHLSAKIFSRGNNHSAVAAAAYRSGEKLHDRRQDKTLDYTRKQRVHYAEIIVPEHAPEWAADRETLWNNVEAAEKRKDAQVAREIEVALPRELTGDAHALLVRDFVQNELVARGMVADISIHESIARDGETNPHAHILLTTREISGSGFGKKKREWNSVDTLKNWRERWADYSNRYLTEANTNTRIDHRSLEAQGVDRQPTKHLGKEATAIEKRQQLSNRGNNLRRAEHGNNLQAHKKRLQQPTKQPQRNDPEAPITPKTWRNSKRQEITYNKTKKPFGNQAAGQQSQQGLRSWINKQAVAVARIAGQARALAERAVNAKMALIRKYTRTQPGQSKTGDRERE